jgi:hypothetical protein
VHTTTVFLMPIFTCNYKIQYSVKRKLRLKSCPSLRTCARSSGTPYARYKDLQMVYYTLVQTLVLKTQRVRRKNRRLKVRGLHHAMKGADGGGVGVVEGWRLLRYTICTCTSVYPYIAHDHARTSQCAMENRVCSVAAHKQWRTCTA